MLSTAWALNYCDYPFSSEFSHQNGNWHDEYYKEGIFVGYRYFDRLNITTRYCFGYGLGYSTFSIENPQVEADNKFITVKATVKNTGSKYSVREVVQVHVSAPKGHLEKPVQVLVGFARSKLLAPGQSDEVTVTCPISFCASYCGEHSLILFVSVTAVDQHQHAPKLTLTSSWFLSNSSQSFQLKSLKKLQL